MRQRSTVEATAAALLAAGALAACAANDKEACRYGTDCPSGACRGGRCVEVSAAGGRGAVSGAGGEGGAGEAAGAAGAGAAGMPTGGTAGIGTVCAPNGDGRIERSEIPLRAGLDAKFLVASNTPVDTAGLAQPDGSRTWDLSVPLAGDHLSLVETQAIASKWYQPSFAEATYAARLSDSEDLLGVFRLSEAALELLGVVSPNGGPTRTELRYDPPVKVLDFPLEAGKGWQTTSTVTGVAVGVPSLYTEEYAYEIDAEGELAAPYGTFEVQRIRVILTRTVGVLPTVKRSFLFNAECFGTVASIVSVDNEQGLEFTTASEVQRLSP